MRTYTLWKELPDGNRRAAHKSRGRDWNSRGQNMLEIRRYRQAESLQEAWELNQKKENRVIGGMLWLKMSRGRCGTAIDLSGLGLDRIEEDDEAFRIGCMATLRQLEMHPALNAYSCGAVRDAVKSIVGVQFRNLATVGGSVWGRFGFSDVLTVFTALGASVELYKRGILPIEEFAALSRAFRCS